MHTRRSLGKLICALQCMHNRNAHKPSHSLWFCWVYSYSCTHTYTVDSQYREIDLGIQLGSSTTERGAHAPLAGKGDLIKTFFHWWDITLLAYSLHVVLRRTLKKWKLQCIICIPNSPVMFGERFMWELHKQEWDLSVWPLYSNWWGNVTIPSRK